MTQFNDLRRIPRYNRNNKWSSMAMFRSLSNGISVFRKTYTFAFDVVVLAIHFNISPKGVPTYATICRRLTSGSIPQVGQGRGRWYFHYCAAARPRPHTALAPPWPDFDIVPVRAPPCAGVARPRLPPLTPTPNQRKKASNRTTHLMHSIMNRVSIVPEKTQRIKKYIAKYHNDSVA